MTTIRPVRPDDLGALHRIHQATSSNPNKTPDQWNLAFMKYVDYYPAFAQETSFVFCDDSGTPLGYILCEIDPDCFIDQFTKAYSNPMESIQAGSCKQFLKSQAFLETFKELYPAHLHIDILPTAQNMHIGSKLMKRLIDELKARQVKGIVLGVSKSRDNAIRFYQKHGFKILEEGKDGYTMGLKLTV